MLFRILRTPRHLQRALHMGDNTTQRAKAVAGGRRVLLPVLAVTMQLRPSSLAIM